MSYDLLFRARPTSSGLSRDDFIKHFGGRPRYQMQESQAWYSNEDSGVYFSFDYRDDDSEPEENRDPTLLPVIFNLNYVRPHVFGLEAEPEVAAFVRAFDLTVSDAQRSGMGDGEYSKEGFLEGWNTGNAFGYRAVRTANPERQLLSLPSARLELLWRWNVEREGRQSALGEAVFVPRIFFFDAGGRVQTGVVWGDGIPILLPVVDLVLVARQQLAPRRWLRSKDDVVVMAWDEVAAIAQRFQRGAGELECFELFYDATPSDIESLIRGKQPPVTLPTGMAFDQILDSELMERSSEP